MKTLHHVVVRIGWSEVELYRTTNRERANIEARAQRHLRRHAVIRKSRLLDGGWTLPSLRLATASKLNP